MIQSCMWNNNNNKNKMNFNYVLLKLYETMKTNFLRQMVLYGDVDCEWAVNSAVISVSSLLVISDGFLAVDSSVGEWISKVASCI